MALQTTMGASEARLLFVAAALFGVVALSSSFAGVEAQDTTETYTPFTSNSQYGNSFSVVWAPTNAWSGNNSTLVLSLTNSSGSAVESTTSYLFGYLRASIKLVSGYSAGVAQTFYLSSSGPNHDEVDFEFLGNVTNQPWILQTNVFANGTGGREQRIYLWFDPTADYHTYAVIWNYKTISMYVDNTLIRIFQNHEQEGQAYLDRQPMNVFASIFDASQWATRGGLDKVDWAFAPFLGRYTNFTMDACAADPADPLANPCTSPTATNWWNAPYFQSLPPDRIAQMENITKVYDYCTDYVRYPGNTLPYECTVGYT